MLGMVCSTGGIFLSSKLLHRSERVLSRDSRSEPARKLSGTLDCNTIAEDNAKNNSVGCNSGGANSESVMTLGADCCGLCTVWRAFKRLGLAVQLSFASGICAM